MQNRARDLPSDSNVEANLGASAGGFSQNRYGVTMQMRMDLRPILRRLENIRASVPAVAERVLRESVDVIVKDLFDVKMAGSGKIGADEFPRGGAYLGVGSGRGRSSVVGRVERMTNKIVGRVGVARGVEDPGSLAEADPSRYVTAHEQGFRGTVRVRAHIRVTERGLAKVRAHVRMMDIPARRFIRAAVLDERLKLHQKILAALDQMVAQSAPGGAA